MSLSPGVGTLLEASWPSSDSGSELSSPSVSPPRGETRLDVGSDYSPDDVQLRNHLSCPAPSPPRGQSVVTVVTPRKVRFLIERINPESVAVPGGSSLAQSLDPQTNTSSDMSSIPAPSFNSALSWSTPPRDIQIASGSSSLFPSPISRSASPTQTTTQDHSIPHIPPPPQVSSSPSPSGPHLTPVDNIPRPPPHSLVPTFVVHRFRAGEQDGYTRSFKTSASFPLSQPPVGEWQVGDVFLHEHDQTGSVQIWIWDSEWVVSREYDPHPTLPDRYLCFRSKLEPSWVKGQTVRSYKSRRRQREGQLLARGKARAC